MPILPPSGPAPLRYTVEDLITDALIEIGAVAPGETPAPEEGQWAFRKANYLLDVWAAQKKYVYSTAFQLFTLTPGLDPHTIGPQTATFQATQRPVRIESASFLFQGSPTQSEQPINLRDEQWWAANRVKNLTSSVVTDLFYSADWPNGTLNFWPVPTTGNQVRLELWMLLSQFASITDPIGGGDVWSLPPAYRTALMLTLAETLLPGSDRAAHPMLVASAQAARVAVFGNNSAAPRIQTRDFGMPKAGKPRADFNWEDGSIV